MNKRWLWLLLLIPTLFIAGFGYYVWHGSAQNAPMPEAEAALQSDTEVFVNADPWYTFTPTETTPTTGFILYPGGLVPPEGYAPTARAIAEEGYLVVLPAMPLNLAVFAPNKAHEIMAEFPEIENWAVGGHSLGGAMAATYVSNNPTAADGVMLWAAYPAESANLSEQMLAVTSIFGSEDGLATTEKVETAVPLLPPQTAYIKIEGGNHTQFGWYGDGLQAGDNPATISREEQQRQIVARTLQLLEEISQ